MRTDTLHSVPMKILARVLALFLIMPVVELALLVQVDKMIGFWPTIGIILFTGSLGAYLAKREGLSVWRKLNQRMGVGDLPGQELIEGVIILCAGALLITPGVLTDAIGFIGLFPPTRALIRKYAMKRIEQAMARGTVTAFGGAFSDEAFDFSESGNGSASPTWKGAPRNMPSHADQDAESRGA